MSGKDLKFKPLVEALLEVRWVLKEHSPEVKVDPHYRLLLGRFSERAMKKYPFHEPLPSSQIPDEMVPHIVQHRFRSSEGKWPLVQIGPGILTVNETEGYTWEDYKARCLEALQFLIESHPSPADLIFTDVTLRYIDAVDFDYEKENVLTFIQDKLKSRAELPSNLFQGTGVSDTPIAFKWQSSFASSKPKGSMTIQFAAGKHQGRSVVLWETLMHSGGDNVPKPDGGFDSWITEAHGLSEDWFFKLIEGELKKKFSDGK